MTASPLSFVSSDRAGQRVPDSALGGRFPERFPARTTLTRRDRVVLRAVAEAMFSQDGEVEDTRLDAHLDEIDSFISSASRPLRIGLRLALFLVRVAPVLLFFRMRMLESLSVDERVTVLGRLERSRFAELSLAFIGWRTVMTFIVYEHPSELAAVGYASEGKVHKRHLALMAPRLVAATPSLVAAPPTPPLVAPPPEESGVRLRDDADRDSENPPAVGEHEHEHEEVA